MSTAIWNGGENLNANAPFGVELLANAEDSNTFEGRASEGRASDEWSYAPPEDAPEICLYRRRTVNLLRRYAKLSTETGRLPSVLGGLEFQARISSYPLHTFEDAVIFVFDVERCLGELSEHEYEVVARIVLRGEEPEQSAHRMQCSRSYAYRLLSDVLDHLTEIFLQRGILARSDLRPKSCQEVENGVFPVSS